MYKVMVVDDEPIVRLALKSLIDWKAYGYHFELEASNGKQALHMLKDHTDVDIIITDINMPVMNGLDFIAEAIKLGNSPNDIIVLSAYDDYNLVRQAFKLGANDYILKSEMEPQSILKLLNTLVHQRKENKHIAVASNNSQNNRISASSKNAFLKKLTAYDNMRDIKEQIQTLGIRLTSKNLAVCFLWVDDYQLVAQRYDNHSLKDFTTSVNNAIYQVLSVEDNGEAISLSPKEYIIFLSFQQASMLQARKKIVGILGNIKHSLLHYVNINVSMGVSNIMSGFEHLKKLFQQSERNARLRFIFGKGRIIFPEDVKLIDQSNHERIIGKEKAFIAALEKADETAALNELEKLLDTAANFNLDTMEKIYTCYMELIFIIIKFLNDIGEDTPEVFGKEINFYEKIAQFETHKEIHIWLKNITAWVIKYLQEKRDAKTSRVVARAQEFIKKHYHYDITLKMVSDYVGLCESHFSCIFTKKTCQTFTQYLTYIRIERAKKLLTTTNMKIYEISVKVGYANVEHFSRVFKKATGFSPNQYKKC